MYLGLDFGTRVKVYKKDLEPGLHKVDDTSALYLFEYKGEWIHIKTSEQQIFVYLDSTVW